MLTWFSRGSQYKPAARQIYAAIMAQSRLSAFYADAGVPDTISGRFEMLVVHMYLVMQRLRGQDEEADKLSQVLSETFVADMDDVMREMGISDMTVAKKMYAAAGAFLGRLKAYDSALENVAASDDALRAALLRNVYSDGEAPADGGRALANYVHQARTQLARSPIEGLMAGSIEFPQPVFTAAGGGHS